VTFAVFVLVAGGILWALLGLGWLCCRAFGYHAGTWAETAGIGLATLIAAGGILNLCRVSFGPVYDCLLLAGMIAAFGAVPRKASVKSPTPDYWYHVSLAVLSLGLLWILGHAQLPPTAFNYHDDFEKYFVHPVRMLQTGTLFSSPLSAIGAETLGGQAVLHGIAVHHFAVPFLFAVDGLFALLLCLLLVTAAIPSGPGRFLLALLCVATVCVVNPVMINVSSIYTTGALLMTVLLVCRSISQGKAECRRQSTLPLVLGLLFSALLALKTTNAIYLLSLFLIAAFVQLTSRDRVGEHKPGMGIFAAVAATALFSLPWVLLHAPHYLSMVPNSINGASFAATEGPFPEPLDLLSFDQLFYGSSYAHYSLLTLIVVLYCTVYFVLSRRGEAGNGTMGGWLMASAAALPVSAMVILALGLQLNGYETNVRYTVPFLIAGSSMLLPVAFSSIGKTNGRIAVIWKSVLVLCGLCVIILYSDQFVFRIRQASQYGNSLAFSGLEADSEYLTYNREVLYGKGAGQMWQIQNMIPAGASVLAWVTSAYHLDFSRNLIYDVEQAGVGNPWARIPSADYVIYQYEGYAVPSLEVIQEDLRHPGRRERMVGRNALAVIDAIENLRKCSTELYNDGETVVFKVLARAGR
jgi:hypothetical protein